VQTRTTSDVLSELIKQFPSLARHARHLKPEPGGCGCGGCGLLYSREEIDSTRQWLLRELQALERQGAPRYVSRGTTAPAKPRADLEQFLGSSGTAF
jgi:hypothetical protein